MGNAKVAPPLIVLNAPVARDLSAAERQAMLVAGREIRECYRVLEKAGLNIVGEVLRGEGEFIELEHYPKDDVFDHETYGQYYYHAHRSEIAEHGHFHTFVRAGGMPSDVKPLAWPLASEPWPQGEQAVSHIIGISMDEWGYPVGLFATNRWVTAETWYAADAVIRMVPAFNIDHAWPSWPVNRWITAMIRLFKAHIVALINHRDAVIDAWQQLHPGKDVFEDRALDVTGHLPVSVDDWIAALEQLKPE